MLDPTPKRIHEAEAHVCFPVINKYVITSAGEDLLPPPPSVLRRRLREGALPQLRALRHQAILRQRAGPTLTSEVGRLQVGGDAPHILLLLPRRLHGAHHQVHLRHQDRPLLLVAVPGKKKSNIILHSHKHVYFNCLERSHMRFNGGGGHLPLPARIRRTSL